MDFKVPREDIENQTVCFGLYTIGGGYHFFCSKFDIWMNFFEKIDSFTSPLQTYKVFKMFQMSSISILLTW